jgi:hypothetical protein
MYPTTYSYDSKTILSFDTNISFVGISDDDFSIDSIAQLVTIYAFANISGIDNTNSISIVHTQTASYVTSNRLLNGVLGDSLPRNHRRRLTSVCDSFTTSNSSNAVLTTFYTSVVLEVLGYSPSEGEDVADVMFSDIKDAFDSAYIDNVLYDLIDDLGCSVCFRSVRNSLSIGTAHLSYEIIAPSLLPSFMPSIQTAEKDSLLGNVPSLTLVNILIAAAVGGCLVFCFLYCVYKCIRDGQKRISVGIDADE